MSLADASALAEKAAKILEEIYDKEGQEISASAEKTLEVLEKVYDKLAPGSPTKTEEMEEGEIAEEEADMELEQEPEPVPSPAPVPAITNHQPEGKIRWLHQIIQMPKYEYYSIDGGRYE